MHINTAHNILCYISIIIRYICDIYTVANATVMMMFKNNLRRQCSHDNSCITAAWKYLYIFLITFLVWLLLLKRVQFHEWISAQFNLNVLPCGAENCQCFDCIKSVAFPDIPVESHSFLYFYMLLKGNAVWLNSAHFIL